MVAIGIAIQKIYKEGIFIKMKLNTDLKAYITSVQKVELYACIQEIIDRVRDFDFEEVQQDPEHARAWLFQLNEIQKKALWIDDIKDLLMIQTIDELNDYLPEDYED